ncbi:hypothetical protein TNCV_654731 [Trichonephila clavipes]|nr:hypothetical protein TNCV_654731 [Trichonephila clavipes]
MSQCLSSLWGDAMYESTCRRWFRKFRKKTEVAKIRLRENDHYTLEDDIDQAIQTTRTLLQELAETFNLRRSRDGWLTCVA